MPYLAHWRKMMSAQGSIKFRFGSLHEVIKDLQEEYLKQGKTTVTNIRYAKRALVHASNEARRRKRGALNKAHYTKLP